MSGQTPNTYKMSMAIKGNRTFPRLQTLNGIFYVAFYDTSIRRMRKLSLRTRDIEAAKKSFALALEDPDGPLQPLHPGRLKTGRALEDYMAEHVEQNCADPKRVRAAIANLNWFFSDTPIADINIPLSRAYAKGRRTGVVGSTEWRRGRIGADSTIARELSCLASAARHAMRWKRIRSLPSIELPTSIKPSDEKAKFFTREQIALLIFNACGETRTVIKLCYYTGARRRSIENLTVGQIDFARNKINLATPGKRPTKKRQPVVPIFPEPMDDLRRATRGKVKTDRLFVGRNFYLEFRKLCHGLELEAPHYPHMLRHSRATHLLEDGKAIYHVAGLLGDTIKTVENHYAHYDADVLLGKLQ